jgi:hypothetical protein
MNFKLRHYPIGNIDGSAEAGRYSGRLDYGTITPSNSHFIPRRFQRELFTFEEVDCEE